MKSFFALSALLVVGYASQTATNASDADTNALAADLEEDFDLGGSQGGVSLT